MLQIRHTILVFLAVLLCSGMIVSPVCAAEYTLTGYQEINVFDVQKDFFTNIQNLTFDKSADDKAITLIHFKVPADKTVSFTIYYGVNGTASGSVTTYGNTSVWPLHTTTSSITFDGSTKTYSYVDSNPEFDYFLSGYARASDNTTGIIVYNAGYGGFYNDLAIFKPVSNIAANLIYRVDLSCDAPFDADISYGTASEVAASVSKSILDVAWDWINFAISISFLVLGFVLMVLGIIKFFFIDNLLLVVALWISVTMAYSAISSKNIFMFYKRFFGYQRALLTFIMELWNYLIQIIASFRGIFRI